MKEEPQKEEAPVDKDPDINFTGQKREKKVDPRKSKRVELQQKAELILKNKFEGKTPKPKTLQQ